jgi:hypothetical protein
MPWAIRSQVREALERAGVTVLLRPIPYNSLRGTTAPTPEEGSHAGNGWCTPRHARDDHRIPGRGRGHADPRLRRTRGTHGHQPPAHRQTLLIAVLSDGQPSESSGIRQVQAAATAAAAAITARVP